MFSNFNAVQDFNLIQTSSIYWTDNVAYGLKMVSLK